jgi:hypothetical protein
MGDRMGGLLFDIVVSVAVAAFVLPWVDEIVVSDLANKV